MSFSYNETLTEEINHDIAMALQSLKEESIMAYIQETARKLMTENALFNEFKSSFEGYDYSFEVEDEHIKNFFIIGLNGIEKVWECLTCPKQGILPYQSKPLYENIFTYLETLTDSIDFGELFKKELAELNR